jgi:glycosyltransferase involved in cell wall biosynthesis
VNICIDARWIKEKIAGIGRYTAYLIRYLAELDGKNRYLILFQNDQLRDRIWRELNLDRMPRFRACVFPHGVFSLQNQLFLPRLLKKEKTDIFHSPNFMAPLPPISAGLVITVHDIIPLKFPHFAPRSKKSRFFFVYKGIMRWVTTIADAIIADSEHSRRDILEFFPIPERKVHTVYLGVDPKYRLLPDGVDREVKKELDIKDKLAVFAGRADPYKNLITLVKAMEILNGTAAFHLTIVVAGERDPRYRKVEDYISFKGLNDSVRFAGSFAETELIRLYNAADLLVLPSLYEGFGLPPLEAMACGTPVICSNRSSLPEVVGDAGILIDPLDEHALADAINRVITDRALRDSLIEKGIRRAALFPWRKTAEKTLELYNSLDNRPGNNRNKP